MQEEILDKHPDADLKVYAVWFSMYPTDERDNWPSDILTDDRVVHYWDETRSVGRWYMERIGEIDSMRAPQTSGLAGNILWDADLVYGPESRWDQAPTGLRRWGRTILRTQDGLRDAVTALVQPTTSSR